MIYKSYNMVSNNCAIRNTLERQLPISSIFLSKKYFIYIAVSNTESKSGLTSFSLIRAPSCRWYYGEVPRPLDLIMAVSISGLSNVHPTVILV